MLSHPMFHQKKIIFLINVLLENGYPLKLIFDTINKRLHQLIYTQRNNKNNETTNNNKKFSYFTISFLPIITDNFKHFLKDTDTRLAYVSLNKLNRFIKSHKDTIPKSSNTNVVYKIICNECSASYVGQTKRRLNTRINEHRKHINRNTNNKSVITEHRINHNHDFDWDDVKMLDTENNYTKRLISEMIHIKRQLNSLNYQTDTECLPDIYENIINDLPKY